MTNTQEQTEWASQYDTADTFNPQWLDPIEIKPALLPVPAFEADFLPSQLRAWCADIAERMSVPIDYPAIPAMVQAGALIGRRVGIHPHQKDDFMQVGNLWGAIVAPPGSLKSPVMSEVLKPIKRLEANAAEENKLARADYEAKVKLAKVADGEQNGAIKKALREGDNAGALAAVKSVEQPERPPERRFLINDATVEKLGEICGDNPMGILLHRDEVMTLFAELEQAEKVSARGFMLSAWDGQDGYTFDRIMRGTVRIESVNISLIGTTQPARIRRFIADSLKSFDDGMVQRLQLLAWPDALPKWTPCDRYPATDAKNAAYECYANLAALTPESIGAEREKFDDGTGIPFLRFDNRAAALWHEYRTDLEAKIRDEDETPALCAHFSKYRGLVPRLALVTHLASGGRGAVTERALWNAICLANYFEGHARRAYGAGKNVADDAALKLLSRIKRGQLSNGNGFTKRNIAQNDWAGLTDGKEVEEALALLCDTHHLMPMRIETGGRPSIQYRINPKLK